MVRSPYRHDHDRDPPFVKAAPAGRSPLFLAAQCGMPVLPAPIVPARECIIEIDAFVPRRDPCGHVRA